jgi:hypothetical protein
MKTFEYKSFRAEDRNPLKLHELGKDGWELVSVIIDKAILSKPYVFFLKLEVIT